MRAYKNSANQSQKMLASTVQFSTYDQTPTQLHRQTRDLPQEERRYDRRTGPEQKQRSPAPSGPNSAPTNRTHPVHHVPHPLARAVLAATREAGRTGQRSTLEHHPRNQRPSETG